MSRNLETHERPSFKDIVIIFMEPEATILNIPAEDRETHKLATVLGGPLEAGEMMYHNLQMMYCSEERIIR